MEVAIDKVVGITAIKGVVDKLKVGLFEERIESRVEANKVVTNGLEEVEDESVGNLDCEDQKSETNQRIDPEEDSLSQLLTAEKKLEDKIDKSEE